MQSQSLTRVQPQLPATLAETQNLGELFCKSGFFADAKQAAQAVVKIMAGAEIGFPPIAAMTGVYIVKGKVSLSANLMAAAIKRSGKYNFKIRKHSAEECSLEFFEMSESVGFSEFTIKEAHAANLHRDWDRERSEWKDKPTWKGFPKNMLFARALSNGAKWFCADIFGGPVYTPDELGATVDGETGEVIDIEPEPQEEKPKAKTARAALKAVPKQEPVIEAEPVIERGEPLPLRAEQVEALEAVELEDDPLPEFAERDADETAAQIESERLSLIEELRNLAAEYLALTGNTPDEVVAKWEDYLLKNDVHNQTRGWLRTKIEMTAVNLNKARANVAPVAIVNPHDAPAELPDGRRKMQRVGPDGKEGKDAENVAVYEKPAKSAYERFCTTFKYWHQDDSNPNRQDYATVLNKVTSAVHNKKFRNFGELDAADLARATHALSNWNPEADAAPGRSVEKKGAKK